MNWYVSWAGIMLLIFGMCFLTYDIGKYLTSPTYNQTVECYDDNHNVIQGVSCTETMVKGYEDFDSLSGFMETISILAMIIGELLSLK